MTSHRPLVSIVMPIYQAAQFIEQSLCSVLAQDYPNLEVLVMDGGSTDGTLEIVERYRDRIHAICSERDGGMFDACNKAIARSTGVLVKIHNADDVMPTDSVSRAVAAFVDAGEIDCVVRGRLGCIDRDGRIAAPAGQISRFPWLPNIAHPTWYVPRRVYDRYGTYATQFRISADTEMYFRLARAGVHFIECPEILSYFRSGGQSSGYRGIKETFLINQEYLGVIPAGFVAAWHATMRAPRLVLGTRIESPPFANIRNWGRRFLWQSSPHVRKNTIASE